MCCVKDLLELCAGEVQCQRKINPDLALVNGHFEITRFLITRLGTQLDHSPALQKWLRFEKRCAIVYLRQLVKTGRASERSDCPDELTHMLAGEVHLPEHLFRHVVTFV
jgi:hypothetical protein